jgi:nucleotide-binding universal stress UspA family protein
MDTRLRRIALMTQWTEFDSGAERMALALAQKGQLALSIVVPLLSNPEFEVVAHALVADAEAATARAAADFDARVRAAGVQAELRVRRGDEPWREVVDGTRAAQADLIVTRRRGHRGFLGKLRVGEMVREIAAHAPCPLLMVPRAAALPSRRALVVIDSDAAVDAAVPPAAALADLLGVGLELVVVSATSAEEGVRRLQRAQAAVRSTKLRTDGVVETGTLGEAVAARLSARSVDLLVLGVEPGQARHGRLGEVVETIVGGAPCATLLVRPQAQLG